MPTAITLKNDIGQPIVLSGDDIKIGFGKAIQSVGYLTAVQSSQTLNTVDQIVNGITKTIIPKGNGSKFLVQVRWFGECANAWSILFNIHMDGIRVNAGGRNAGLGSPIQSYPTANNDSSTPETQNISTLVETESVIGIPIKFDLVADTHSSFTMWTNRCFADDETGTSEIIITEIQGD